MKTLLLLAVLVLCAGCMSDPAPEAPSEAALKGMSKFETSSQGADTGKAAGAGPESTPTTDN